MPTVPKSLLEKMPTRAEIARLLGLEPSDAERKFGYERPADCILDAAWRPSGANHQYVGVVTIAGRKFRIWPDRDVYAEDAPPRS